MHGTKGGSKDYTRLLRSPSNVRELYMRPKLSSSQRHRGTKGGSDKMLCCRRLTRVLLENAILLRRILQAGPHVGSANLEHGGAPSKVETRLRIHTIERRAVTSLQYTLPLQLNTTTFNHTAHTAVYFTGKYHSNHTGTELVHSDSIQNSISMTQARRSERALLDQQRSGWVSEASKKYSTRE
ncbi:hypothetical protein BC629DRAFT_505280 [Irpex lacteus]|nr:hypothetical protein BC629DRAFT_505280 [Irpex lacteus]